MANTNGLSFNKFLTSKGKVMKDLQPSEIPTLIEEYKNTPNNNGLASISSEITFCSKVLNDDQLSAFYSGLAGDSSQESELVKLAIDTLRKEKSLFAEQSSLTDQKHELERAQAALLERERIYGKNNEELIAETNKLNDQIKKYNDDVKTYKANLAELTKAQEELAKREAALKDKEAGEGAALVANDEKHKKEIEALKRAAEEEKNAAVKAAVSENDAKWQGKYDEQGEELTESKKSSKGSKTLNLVLGGALITSLTLFGLREIQNDMAKDAKDQNIADLTTNLEESKSLIAQYIEALNANNGKTGKYNFKIDETTGALTIEIDENVVNIENSDVDVTPFIEMFDGLVEKGVLSEEAVDSIVNEDGTINEESLVTVSGVLYSYYEDMCEYQTIINEMGETLADTLNVVGVQIEDEKGNAVNATLDSYTDENGFVDYVTMGSDVYTTITTAVDIFQSTLEDASAILNSGTVVLDEESTESITTLMDLATGLQTTVNQVGEAYNTAVQDITDLREQISNQNSVIEDLNNENKDLSTENENLSKENEGLKNENEDLSKENEGLKNENENLSKENEDLKNSINNSIEGGTTGESDNESGETPATPSGDSGSEQDKEDEQGSKGNNNNVGSSSQGGSELGG